jgi:hypothetical protein
VSHHPTRPVYIGPGLTHLEDEGVVAAIAKALFQDAAGGRLVVEALVDPRHADVGPPVERVGLHTYRAEQRELQPLHSPKPAMPTALCPSNEHHVHRW